jgi:hypothetical protein
MLPHNKAAPEDGTESIYHIFRLLLNPHFESRSAHEGRPLLIGASRLGRVRDAVSTIGRARIHLDAGNCSSGLAELFHCDLDGGL